MIYVIAFICALSGLLFGYDTGAISGAILYLKQEFGLSSGQQEIIVSIALAGAAIGAAFGGTLADRYGRRPIIIVTAVALVLGSLVTGLAPSVAWLIGGRLLIGSAIGIGSFVAPLYLSEMAPASVRGTIVSLNQFAITGGILLSYLVDFAFAYPGGWHWMFALGAVPASVLAIGMTFLPSSPRWLVMRGRLKEARLVLHRIHSASANLELDEIRNSLSHQKAGFGVLLSPLLRRPLMIGVVLAALQQVTGINTVIYYAPTIFQFAGFNSAQGAILATIGVGIVNTLTTVIALWLIDRVGRRLLLLVGVAGMTLSLIVLGAGFLSNHGSPETGRITAIGLMSYVGFFAIGLGPVFWLTIAEIYPLRVRGLAMSVATVVNWTTNLLVALTFLSLVDLLGRPATFWLYAVFSAGAFVFTWRLIPETKGKTLEEIETHWLHGGETYGIE